jgi:hypothetical protein
MTGHIRVRLASLDDVDAVSELLQHSYPILMAPGYSEEVLAHALPLIVARQSAREVGDNHGENPVSRRVCASARPRWSVCARPASVPH